MQVLADDKLASTLASDIFSLGVVLWEIVTSQRPFNRVYNVRYGMPAPVIFRCFMSPRSNLTTLTYTGKH